VNEDMELMHKKKRKTCKNGVVKRGKNKGKCKKVNGQRK
jgi:hypothetical protein